MKGIKVKWITSGVIAVILVISLALAACAPAPGKAPVLRLMCGTAAVVSGHYPSSVAMAKIINENVPEVNISLVETGGTHACTGRLGTDLDMFAQTSYNGPVERYNGIDTYAEPGKQLRDIRMLAQYAPGLTKHSQVLLDDETVPLQHHIKRQAAMPLAQDEIVPLRPFGISRVILQAVPIQN